MMTDIYEFKIDVDRHLNPSLSRASKGAGPMRYGLFGQHTMRPNHALRVAGTFLVATLALTACKLDEKDIRLEPPLVRVTTVVPAAQAERAFTGVISEVDPVCETAGAAS